MGFALAGFRSLFRYEPNARIHTAVALAAIGMGFWLGLAPLEWVAVVLCVGLVFAAELFNTALERLADAVTPEIHPLVKAAKDCAAAAVLVTATTSAIVGLIIFLPRLVTLMVPPP